MWELITKVPDDILATLVPILVYWVYSGLLALFEPIQKYRLHPKDEEEEKNLVAKSTVIKTILLLQIMQAIIATVIYKATEDDLKKSKTKQQPPIYLAALQFLIAMTVLDTCTYFSHRYLHSNKFLYRHVHSIHHKLLVPYAYGALYNHPVEGLLEIVGGAIAHWVSGMTTTTSMIFFSFATIKAIDDHSGLWIPGNPIHILFKNNSAYHDIHHQLSGNKFNFSQPFFTIWDKMLGTHMPYSVDHWGSDGFVARPLKEKKVH